MLVVGVLERKRVEVVLHKAGVPADPEGFAAWMERDPEALVRLVCAVVGAAPEHRERVREAVAAWWPRERERGGTAVATLDWGLDDDESEVDVPAEGRAASPWAGRVAALVTVLAAALVVAFVFMPGWNELIGSGTSEGGSTTQALDDGGDSGDSDPFIDTETTGGASDESDSTESGSTGEPPVPEYEVDLTKVSVRVPVATLEVVPGEFQVPWPPLGMASLALLVFVILWRTKPPSSLLPAAPDQEPQPTRAGRLPPRSPPLRRILLDRQARDTLVSGIARDATDRPTEDVDVPRSIDVTLSTGVPTRCHRPATEYRGVWIWRDTLLDDHAELAERLELELEATLRDAGLPAQTAEFDGSPSSLFIGHRTLGASSPGRGADRRLGSGGAAARCLDPGQRRGHAAAAAAVAGAGAGGLRWPPQRAGPSGACLAHPPGHPRASRGPPRRSGPP